MSQPRLMPIVLILAAISGSNARVQPSSEQKLPPALLGGVSNQRQRHHHLTILSKVAPVLGESAIIDKETNRVFWQGGRQSLFQSILGHSYLSKREGIARHIRATLLSCVLWISCIRFLARWLLKQTILSRAAHKKGAWTFERARNFSIKIFLKVARFRLILVSFLPKFHSAFVIVALSLYLIESYTCSTRIFLDNALVIPDGVEEHMESLRKQLPIVKWEIRCFHYERKRWLSALLLLNLWEWLGCHLGMVDREEIKSEKYCTPSIMRKKVVTHKSNEIYTFESCEDQTVAGIWKQSQGISLTAPFTKISLSKVVLFSDAKAKADYFRQQSDFVNRFGKLDKLAEFSTSIQVHGYRPKLLAIRPTQGLARPTHQFRVYHFWLYTILGLTVPFRIMFARHCDELRVAVVKETSAECKTEGLMSSWVSKSCRRMSVLTSSSQLSSKTRSVCQTPVS